MNYTGVIIEIKKTSVRVRANHDSSLLTWAEWQTDIGGEPKIGRHCRIRNSGGLIIAF
jgi:hypothetical protein